MSVLHLTNGDATVPGLRGTGLADAIEPWRDVLHEGPVPDVPRLRLTDPGRRVLSGGDDHVGLNGVDRWIGGVEQG